MFVMKIKHGVWREKKACLLLYMTLETILGTLFTDEVTTYWY